MATSSIARHAWRVLGALLLITAVLFGANTIGVLGFKEGTWVPELALDLQGGTQITLEARTDNAEPTAEELAQAVTIIRQRVDAAGVGETEVSTQGAANIVVQIPGVADEQTRQRIQSSAQMQLRTVILGPSDATAIGYTGEDGNQTPFPTPDPGLSTERPAEPTAGNDPAWISPALEAEYFSYDCQTAGQRSWPEDGPMIACDANGVAKYLLGPLEIAGSSITDAQALIDQQNGRWTVNVRFDDQGRDTFTKVSQKLFGAVSPQNLFAFVLDETVISAPSMDAVITDGRPSISGTGINQESAQVLADQLKFGALPVSFDVVSSETISATLGSDQLRTGIIAGVIGLGLVCLYVLFTYRALGFVIIASLGVMAVLTYVLLCLLSWRIDYRLSLAGVAGLIITIGSTADSFIVYFERIRDELRDGKTVNLAIEDGWARARRTIFISKSINVLASVVLYVLADATVKGFAFTLGLTTLLDILIFVMFTHPVMQLLGRRTFFASGHPLSGLDPSALGAVYRGRAQFRTPVARGAKQAKSRGEAQKRQTIAERKEAERLAAAHGERTD